MIIYALYIDCIKLHLCLGIKLLLIRLCLEACLVQSQKGVLHSRNRVQLQGYLNMPAKEVVPIIPPLRKQRQDNPRVLLTIESSKIGKIQVHRETLDHTSCWPLASTLTYTHMHVHTLVFACDFPRLASQQKSGICLSPGLPCMGLVLTAIPSFLHR